MKFDRTKVSELAQKYDSFYLYDENVIKQSIGALKDNFKNVQFLYSVKANPHPAVLDCIFSSGIGADAASLNEVLAAEAHGLKPDEIYYSAPGKSESDIKEAFGKCVIIADSLNEVERINKAAAQQGIVAEIGIRINPNFTFDGDKGAANKFGIDEETVFENIENWKTLSNIKIVGIHVHSRSQELNGKLIADYYGRMFGLSLRFQTSIGEPLRFVNMGSGIGIPYAKDDKEVDITKLGAEMTCLVGQYSEKLPNTKIIIESGRFLVGKSGVYVTKVVDIKQSHGKTFVLLSNTLNGFVRPSIACMVEGYNQLIAMAHNAGVEIYFCELTPWQGYTRNVFNRGDDVEWCEEYDQLRKDINAWFASDDCGADGIIRLAGMADPANPNALIPSQTPDGIHHNAEGQANFVSLFPLDIFA